MSQPKPSL
ncbi:hypothetical protein VTP21DRAFT_11360 [Calcarisporiella thermophila]